MTKKTVAQVIACGVLAIDINRLAKKLGMEIKTRYLPGGLHNEPLKLRHRLQSAIDQASQEGGIERIIVGYGVCGMGTIEVQARDVPLVIPRVHDCIALFLGSNQAYKKEFAENPGTYYFSAGWCEEKVQPETREQQRAWIGDKSVTFEELDQQFGSKHAQDVIDFHSTWKKNYQRAVFIDTGAKFKQADEDYARSLAKEHGWQFQKIKGKTDLLEKMLTAETTNDEVLVVPPHHFTAFDAIQGRIMAVPEKAAGSLPLGKSRSKKVVKEGPEKKAEQDAHIRYGLGIDAGGTYTDAVIYRFGEDKLLGKSKALTTKWDFTVGIKEALDGLDAGLLSQVELVAVSTTMATNAIVEGDGQKVGLLLMTPFGLDKRDKIGHEPKQVIQGRIKITGEETQAVDPGEVRRVVRQMVDAHQVGAFAVSGFGGAINPAHELAVKQIIRDETGLSVTCGHELSELLDFTARARTAVLNARIIPRLEKLIAELEQVLRGLGIKAPMVVVKGDGSLIASEVARDRPVETIMSGPAASVAGALHLTGKKDAIVVDIGGTTMDTAALKDGMVHVIGSGVRVGGHYTHVKALKMRTIGLGGDSSIVWEKSKFAIGPRRVAPMAWLGGQSGGAKAALKFLENRLDRYRVDTRPMQMLMLTGHSNGLNLTAQEQEILSLLKERPFSLDELGCRSEAGYWAILPLKRLEEHYIVQRCGFTPTDLLHIKGLFEKWDKKTSQYICGMLARIVPYEQDELVDYLLDATVKQVAVELLKNQLEGEADTLDECPVCKTLVSNLLAGGGTDFTVNIKLHSPIIGIGAPAPFFLPRAAEILQAEAILPKDADVANALGAITSNVMVRRQAKIKPTDAGRFVIEGFEGARSFKEFQEAHDWAEQELRRRVIELGRLAGTGSDEVEIEIDDSIVNSGLGTQLFLGRTITAQLSGRPDIVLGQ
jgi:N-methylhydantoinase A/oxoprolinase/acetone carboxylase beta subunit